MGWGHSEDKEASDGRWELFESQRRAHNQANADRREAAEAAKEARMALFRELIVRGNEAQRKNWEPQNAAELLRVQACRNALNEGQSVEAARRLLDQLA